MTTETSTHGADAESRRSIVGLLNSGGKMALVGLAASLATLGFTLWLQFIILQQAKVGEPLMRASMELEHLLDQTFTVLNGWIAYGDPDSKAVRAALWTVEIEPRLERIKVITRSLRADDFAADVTALEERLRHVRYLQWYAEDVARSPNNVPASALYERELRKMRRRALEHLKPATYQRKRGADTTSDAHELLAALLELDRQVITFIDDGLGARAASRYATTLTAVADRVETRWRPFVVTDPLAESIVAGARQARSFAARVPRVIALRTTERWNVAQHLYTSELKPLQQEVATIAQRISGRQLTFVTSQAKVLAGWSFVVLALSILLGAISVASLVVNYRLENRVQRALERAKSLGQYVIEEHVGGGGMGDVYRARHALLRRPSAVKVLRLESALDPKAQQRFQNEVQMTSQLTHPNTIAIFDYGRTPDGLFYYAMELLNGVTLDALVDVTGPLPASRVVHILQQVCGSLEEAHQKGLLHRDIKPSNIMVTELGGVFDRVKVLDFGLVTQVRAPNVPSPNGHHTIVGTPAYLAPETIRSESNASPRSDIYALGAVAYFLLTGQPVFEDTVVADVLRAHLERAPVPPSRRVNIVVPEDLEILVLSCLAKDPNDRPKSADALHKMLAQVDLPSWTPEDALIWWNDFGEAVRAHQRRANSASSRSRIGVKGVVDVRELTRS